jgi:hypothetical protein
MRDYQVAPDELRALGTGQGILALEPVGGRVGRRIEPVLLACPNGSRPGAADARVRPD